MKLSQFRDRVELALPNIGQVGVDDVGMNSLINQAVVAVNGVIRAYHGYTDIDVVAGQKEYDLSVVAPSFIGRDKRGAFFKSGGDWKKLYPRTDAYLAEYQQTSLNSDPVSVPNYYYIHGNVLGLEPAADASQTAGLRLFHLKRPTDMTNDDHYPFSGTTTEVVALLPLDEAIIAWCKWRIAPAYGTVTDVDLKEREYLAACMRAEKEIKSMPDVSMSSFNRMRA